MTCYVALKLIEMLQLDPKEVYFIVPRIAARIKGTSANLKTGILELPALRLGNSTL
jgi:hypothetical protein